MSQYHFHFYGDGPSGLPKQGLVVTTTPPAADARMVRSVSHPPPRAPLPLRNVSPRPASTPPGRLSRDRSPDRHRSPRRERSQRHHTAVALVDDKGGTTIILDDLSRLKIQLKLQQPGPHLARQVYKLESRCHGQPRLVYCLYSRDRLDLVLQGTRRSGWSPLPGHPSPERPPGQWTPTSGPRPVSSRPAVQFQKKPASRDADPQQILQQAAASFRSQPASSVTAPAVASTVRQQVLQPAAAASTSLPASSDNAPAVPAPDHRVAPVTPPKKSTVVAKGPPPRSTPSPMDDEPMFQATHRSTYEQLQEQITRRAKSRNAVDYYEEGMSPLLAYMFFVLHYHENFLTINGIHEWPIIPHSAIRRFTDRVAWIRQYSVPMPRILREDVEHVLQFLLTRFGPADKPFLPMIPIGQREVMLLAKAILASKIPYREIFQHDAKAYALPQEALHVWELPVATSWGHGTSAEGLVGETVPCSMSKTAIVFVFIFHFIIVSIFVYL